MRTAVTAYGVSLAALAVAVLLRWLLDPIMGDALPLVTLFGAVASAVWAGGHRPAIVVAVLGYVACAYLFIQPRGTFAVTEPRNLVGLVAYLVTCAIIVGFGEAVRVSRSRFEDLARQQDALPSPLSTGTVESIRRKHSLRDVAVSGFVLTFAVFVGGSVLGFLSVRRLSQNEWLVTHTHEVIGQLAAVTATLTDAETGQRGYLLTGDQRYLEPYDEALGRVDATVGRLKQLTADNADQQARLAVLEQKIELRLEELRRTVAWAKGGDRAAAVRTVRRKDKAAMDDVRRSVAAMRGAEEALLRDRAGVSRRSFHTAVLSTVLPGILGVLLLGLVFHLSERNLRVRQRAADVLAEQRERLRVTLASIGDAVITTDAEGRITYLNAVAESLTGWVARDAEGLPLDGVFRIENEQTGEPAANPATRALREGVIVGLANHTVLVRKDGTTLPIDDSAAPMRSETGQLLGCVLVFRDISARRQSERALRESESRLKGIITSATDAIITVDADQKVVVFNAAAEGMFGYSMEEMAGQTLDRLVPERVRPMLRGHVDAFGLTGVGMRAMGAERVLGGLRRNGDEFPMEARISQVEIDGRNFYTVILRDITERQRAEAERAQLAAIVSSSDDAIISKTLDGVVTSWNAGAERLFGYTADEMIGQPISRLIPPELPDDFPKILRAIRDGKRVEHFETQRMRKDGRRIHVSLTVSPIRDAAGRIVGASKIARDVTDRIRADEERETLLAVAERARAEAEVAARAAEEAREEAEAASRAKDAFLATVSHELRTPLSPILAWARMLRMGDPAPEKVVQGLAAIERCALSQAQLVEDLLDVSRIVAGKMRLEVHPVVVAPIIERAVDVVRPAADAKNVRLQVVLDTEVGTVSGDAERLQQVAWNLLSNAVKFTPKGGRVQVVLERVNSHVEIAVSDTGEGIAPEFLPYVFERFQQADMGPSRAHGGLGLGLAIVRHIVEAHGGTVHAESAGAGRGAVFTVKLPLMMPRTANETERRHPTTGRAGDDGDLQRLDGLRILLVDDEPESNEGVGNLLQSCGADVRTALSATHARSILADWKPDILVSDVGMPGEDGYAFISSLRAQDGTLAQLPAVALTAYASRGDRVRLLSAGFQAHVAKPLEAAELVAVLASIGRTRYGA